MTTHAVGPIDLKTQALEGLEAVVYALREPCTLEDARQARQVGVTALHAIKVAQVEQSRETPQPWLLMLCTRHGQVELHICEQEQFQRMATAYETSAERNKVVRVEQTLSQMNDLARGARAAGIWICWCGA